MKSAPVLSQSSFIAPVVFVVVLLAMIASSEGNSIKSKCIYPCRDDQYCDPGSRHCEACAEICESRDEQDQYRCRSKCSEYLKKNSDAETVALNTPFSQVKPSPTKTVDLEESWETMALIIIGCTVSFMGLLVVGLLVGGLYFFVGRNRRVQRGGCWRLSVDESVGTNGSEVQSKAPLLQEQDTSLRKPPQELSQGNGLTDKNQKIDHPTDENNIMRV